MEQSNGQSTEVTIDNLPLEEMSEDDKKRHELVGNILKDLENDIDPEGWEDITGELFKTEPNITDKVV
jgi:hypothetical protein